LNEINACVRLLVALFYVNAWIVAHINNKCLLVGLNCRFFEVSTIRDLLQIFDLQPYFCCLISPSMSSFFHEFYRNFHGFHMTCEAFNSSSFG